MSKGRKPTPTYLKVVRGNPGKRPLPQNEPKPKKARKRPTAPSHVSEIAKGIWDQIVKELDDIAILTTIDVFAVEILCEALADHRASGQQIETARAEYAAAKAEDKESDWSADGRYYRTRNKDGGFMWRAHPAVALRSDADRRLRAWCAEFGLTPSARTRLVVGTGGTQAENDDDDEFFGT